MDRKDIGPLSNLTSKAENIWSVANDIQFTDRKLFIKDRTNCTDRKLNSRTVTVRVYWTTFPKVGAVVAILNAGVVESTDQNSLMLASNQASKQLNKQASKQTRK